VELDWLQTFVVAAETMNFHQTADILHLAQPTVSLHIHKLEQALGLKLFERKGRNVVLTAAGRRYLTHARNVLDAMDAGREDMLRWRQGWVETVRIAVSPLVATTVLPRWIQKYSADRPATQFSILVRESAAIPDSLIRGESDVGFTRMRAANPHVECIPLYPDPVTLVAPADGQDLDGPLPTPAELFAQYPVITHNHPEYWDPLLLTLRRAYPDVRTMQISQVHVTIHWIGEKLGVSFLPASTVRRELLRGNLIEVPFHDFPLPVATTYLVVSSGGVSPAAASFVRFVREYMSERSF
jgi:LysR family transcriptional repressor of citA